MTPSLLRAVLLLGCLQPAAAQAPAPTLSLDDLMARLAAAPERHAAFREEKRLAALDQPLLSEGTLTYSRPDHLEKASGEERLVVDGDRLTVTAGNEAPRVIDLGSQPGALALVDTIRGALSGNLALLRRSYDVTPAGSLAEWRLSLRPRQPALAQFIREVRIEGSGDAVRTIETLQANGDTDRLTITTLP